jgi:hypothetical protein
VGFLILVSLINSTWRADQDAFWCDQKPILDSFGGLFYMVILVSWPVSELTRQVVELFKLLLYIYIYMYIYIYVCVCVWYNLKAIKTHQIGPRDC